MTDDPILMREAELRAAMMADGSGTPASGASAPTGGGSWPAT